MKKKVQNSRMFLAGLALLIGSSFAWAVPAQWLTGAEEVAAGYSLPGDANGDGVVDVVDVTTVVDFILEKATPTDAQKALVDINNDGSIDVVDLTSIVDIILGK